MTLFENLAAVGLTTSVLQYIIFGAIALIVAGLYWHYIVAGAGILFCAYVFASPINLTSNEKSAVVDSADVVPAEYIEDCIRYGDNATKTSCIKLWKEQGNGKE
jgi:hypothetical protein